MVFIQVFENAEVGCVLAEAGGMGAESEGLHPV